MSVRDLIAATAALLLAAAPLASAHAQGAEAKDSVQADAKLVRWAVEDNMLEARLGDVAKQQATNGMVQKFGERMALDHGRLQNQWADLASKHGITVPDTLSAKGKQRVDRLEGLPKSSFDKEYMTAMLKAHAKVADKLRTAQDSARSDPVRKLANYELPIVREHLAAASVAAKEVGVDSTVVNESKEIAEGKASK
jgi:predicted outer membrane protein